MAAIHVGGTSVDRKTFRMVSKVHGMTVDFYPERGMITIRIEEKDGAESYKRVSRVDFLQRAKALSLEVRWLLNRANQDSGKAHRHRQEAAETQQIVDCMILAARAAWDQGDPLAEMKPMRGPSRIAKPTFESQVSAIPTAPVDTVAVKGPTGEDPRSVLSLPPGVRRQLGYQEG